MGLGVGIDVRSDGARIVKVRTSPDGVEILHAGTTPVDELDLPRATVGFSGRGLMFTCVRMPPAPPWRLKRLVDFEISQNIARGSEAVWDYRPLPLQAPGGGLVLLVAVAKRSPLEEAFDLVRPRRMVPSAVALQRAFTATCAFREGETTLLLDLGRESVEMAIQRDGELLFARTGSAVDGVEAVAGVITAGVKFASVQTGVKIEPDRVVLSGDGAGAEGLCEGLRRRLGKPVDTFDGGDPRMAVALGLAVIDAEPGVPVMELVPPREAARREFWGRKVFLYAACALAAAAAAVMVAGARLDEARARRAREALSRRLDRLESRSAGLRKLEEEVAASAGELAPLAERFALNRALLDFLPALRRTCPDGLSVTSLRVVPGDVPTVVFEGVGRGEETAFLDQLKAFRAALEAEAVVGAVSDIRKQPARRWTSEGAHGFHCEVTLRPWGGE